MALLGFLSEAEVDELVADAVAAGSGVASFNTRTGAVSLTSGDVTTALTFTPYNATNPSGYITGINSSMVTTALGYTPTSVTGLTGSQSVAAFKTGLSLVKADVGLGSVDNTSDAGKPVSTAQQTALDLKLDDSQAGAFGLTLLGSANLAAAKASLAYVKGDVGLGSADNTADVAKAVLSATVLATPRNINGIAFDGSGNITINAVDSTARAPETRTISTTAPLTGGGDLSANRTFAITAASGAAAGSMSAADKTKLDAITADATELNVLDGATLTTTELNYVDGVTSAIQAQLNTKTDTANSPNANEFARFTDADTIEGRTTTETRSDLGLVIGTNVQAWAANLDEYAAVNPTAAGLALLDDADASAQRTTLALGTSATVNTGTSGATIPLLSTDNVWGGYQQFGAGLRSEGTATPASGAGVEIIYSGGAGSVQAYNRTGGAYVPLNLDGLSLTFKIGGTGIAAVTATGLEPATDNTFYLGRNDDDSPKAWKGAVFHDQGNGKTQLVTIVNNTFVITDLTD